MWYTTQVEELTLNVRRTLPPLRQRERGEGGGGFREILGGSTDRLPDSRGQSHLLSERDRA